MSNYIYHMILIETDIWVYKVTKGFQNALNTTEFYFNTRLKYSYKKR